MSLTAPTYAEFIVNYPEFADVQPSIVNRLLRLSMELLSSSAWGDSYSSAIELDVAHRLALQALVGSGASGAAQAAAGPVNSVSGAGVSISFSTPDVSNASEQRLFYLKTSYGQQFLYLQSLISPMGIMCA